MVYSTGGMIEEMKAEIKKGDQVHLLDKYDQTALMYAVRARQIDAAKLLIKNHVDINMRSRYWGTALIMASYQDMARLLIKNGAKVNIRDREGRTALRRATGRNRIIDMLKRAGARQ